MILAQGTLNRIKKKAREEAQAQAAALYGSGNEDAGSSGVSDNRRQSAKSPRSAAYAPGDDDAKDAADKKAPDTPHVDPEAEIDEDPVVLIETDGLTGLRLKYVKCANLARRAVKSTALNSTVMLCISWATLSVGLQTYNSLASNVVLDRLDTTILCVFIVECFLKVVAEGLTPWRFFSGKEMRWNIFDFCIIIMSLPMWGSALGGSSNIAILRMLRLLRIMKLVKRVPQLYMIIMGLIGGLKSIGYILLLLFLVFYLYAITGMYAWATNDPFHFRNVPIAIITLFRMSTLENWSAVMNINYWGCDRYDGGYYSNDVTQAANFQYCNVTALYGDASAASINTTRFVNQVLAMLFFLTFIPVSAFVMLSLFIGAITMSMTTSMEQMKAAQEEKERRVRLEKARKRAKEAEQREKERAERQAALDASSGRSTVELEREKAKGLSAAEKRERQKMRAVLMQTWDDYDLTEMLSAKDEDTRTLKGLYLKLSGGCAKIVESPKFVTFVTLVIVLAGLLVGLQTSSAIEDAVGGFLSGVDSAILAVFTVEVVLKVVAEGLEPWNYFRTGWNVFDFIIVVGSYTRGKGGMLTMLRLLRLLRVLKLVKAFPQLQVIVSALMKGLGSIGYIGLILILCFYVFGIIGNMLFANNDPFHFGQLHYAMISLFSVATMDGWSDVSTGPPYHPTSDPPFSNHMLLFVVPSPPPLHRCSTSTITGATTTGTTSTRRSGTRASPRALGSLRSRTFAALS